MRLPFRTLGGYKHLLAETMRFPRFANFFITTACTCRCVMCNFWRLESNFISLSLFQKSVTMLEDLGFYNFSLTGGEPLAHPKYFTFVRHLRNRGFYVSSATNGTLLTEKNVKKLKESGIDSVNVSIDSLDRATCDRVRGHTGQLRKGLEGLRLLKEYGVPYSTVILLAKHKIHELSQMIKLLDRVYDSPCILSFPDSGVGPLSEMLFTKDELLKVVDELFVLKREGYRLQNTNKYLSELKHAYLDEPREIVCYGGYYVVNVYWNGDVRPCFNTESLGYITELKELRKKPCTNCLNQCFIEFSYIIECLHRKQFLATLREWWPNIMTNLS